MLPFLALLLCVLTVASCRDTAPRSRWSRSSRALTADPSSPPDLPPECPRPGDVPDPFPPDLPPGPTAEVGTLAGAFSVSASGDAAYSIPLPVLPGRAGIEPKLAITYSSSGDDGPLGHGFSLTGLSAITRCARNVAQDGEIRPVQDDHADALCMDGQRLVPLDVPFDHDPNNPYQSREYRTYPDTFTRIRADFAGSEGWPAERGPKRLRAFTKSGLVLDYGSTDDGQVLSRNQVVRAWLLTRMSDRSGNALDVHYINRLHPADGYTVEHAPLRIDYTGHPLAPPSRAVEFVYGPLEDADARIVFARGLELRRSLRLDAVRMLGPGDALAREVLLDYGQAPATGRLLLQSVEECAAGGACRPPTRFTWHTGGSPGFTWESTPVAGPESDLASLMLLDATGDGLDDLLIPDVDMTGGAENPYTNWILAPNRSDELTPTFFDAAAVAYHQLHITDASPIHPEVATPIDYNHDGRMDLFLHDVYGSATKWKVLLASGNGSFTWHSTGVDRPFTSAEPSPAGLRSAEASAHLADVDGDGVPDLIQCKFNGTDHSWGLHRWRPAGPGFEVAGKAIHELSPYPCHAELHTVDLDADGRTELVVQELLVLSGQGQPIYPTYESLTYEIAGGSWTRRATGLRVADPGGRLIFLDVNGDGLPDAVQNHTQDGQLYTSINTGDGFTKEVESLPTPLLDAAAFLRVAAVLDYNADGRQDLLLPMADPGDTPSWRILQATGSVGAGTFAIVDPGLPISTTLLQDQAATLSDARAPRVTDLDGDGTQDLLYLLSDQVQVFRNTLRHEDLLATVSNGMNAHDPGDAGYLPDVQIAYDALVDRARTTQHAAGAPGIPIPEQRTYLPLDQADESQCAYPVRCVVGPRRVVSGYTLNNGADQPRRFQVAYRHGRYHRLGRGWLGFGARIVRDLDTGSGSADFHDNTTWDELLKDFPFARELAMAWRWSPSRPRLGSPEPSAVELLSTRQLHAVERTPGGSYFTVPSVRRETRRQGTFSPANGQTLEAYVRTMEQDPATELSDTWQMLIDWDPFGSVLSEVSFTDGVDLKLQVTREVDNDTDEWRIGELRRVTECSTALGETQCRTTRRDYGHLGRVVKEERAADGGDPETELTTWFQRDAFGNLTIVTAEDGFGHRRVACTSYDEEGLFPFARINPAGHLSYTRYDAALGVLEAAVDPDGLVTRWAHDGFGEVTREVGPDGVETTVTRARTKDGGPNHDAWNVKITTQTQGSREDTAQLDPLGREVRRWWRGLDVGAVPAPRLMQEIAFDATGQHVERRSLPIVDPAPPNTAQYWERWEYDGMGRVVRHVAPWFAETTYQYLGRSVITSGPGGAITRTEQDPLGRPVEIVDPEGGITAYEYGPFGGLRRVTDPGGAETVTVRDAYGRVRRSIDPDRGETEAHYNGFDELVSSLDAAQRLVERTYDPLGRPLTRTDDDGETRWTWDTAPHGVGQLAAVEGPDGHTLSYGYDALGRPRTTTLRIDGEAFTTGVTYDGLGRVETVRYPEAPGVDALAVQHERDAYGHLRAVKDAATGAEIWRATGTDLGGRMTGERFGGGVVTTARSYDAMRQRVNGITTTGAAPVQQLSYLWSDRLALRERHDALQAQTERFLHDDLGRLTCVLPASGPCPVDERIQYAPNGNLLYKPGVGAYSYDPAQPHAAIEAGSSSYAYDAVGNQWSRPGATIAYTAFDLPKVVTLDSGEEIRFEYDGDQQRVRKATLWEETVYVGDLYERVTDFGTGAVEHRYHVHAGERAVAVVRRAAGEPSRTRYVHVDHLGSIDAVTDEGGALDHRRSYDAFGARRAPVWSAPVPASFPASEIRRGFTAHEADEELGLVNMKGRMYDPKLARFLTPDPLVAHPQFGQSWNPYSYVLNSPLSRVDPSGFQDELTQIILPSHQPQSAQANGGGELVVWVFGEPRGPKPPPPPPPPKPQPQAAEALAVHPPADLSLWGNSAGWMPGGSPLDTELPRVLEIGARIQDGAWSALQETALGAISFVGLTMVTFGGYGAYTTGSALWGGFKQDGILGALNALNPLYHLGRSAVDTFAAADRGDWEAVGQGGVKTGVAAVAAAGAVAGAAGAARAAVRGAATAAEAPAIPSYSGGKTAGVLRTIEGDLPLLSGYKGPTQTMPRGTPGMNHRIKSHVEAHAAAHMRQNSIRDGVLYINRAPCPGGTGCEAMLPRMLPEGAQLRVLGPNGYDKTFVGLPD